MTKFACGSCCADYNRKHAPRYISAGETSYPVSLAKVCAQCSEISTHMEICLGCALENNQCQNCRTQMFGVRKDLLEKVRDFRARFNRSVAAHQAVLKTKKERDLFLQADRQLFAILVEHAVALDRLRFSNVSSISHAVSSSGSFADAQMPPPIETHLSSFAISLLTEDERQLMDRLSRESFETGRAFYERMTGAFGLGDKK